MALEREPTWLQGDPNWLRRKILIDDTKLFDVGPPSFGFTVRLNVSR
jgi:hypothetical protein